MTKQQGYVVLAIAGAIAIGVGVYEARKGPGDVGCVLTGAGLTGILEGVSKGHSGEAIIASTGVAALCVPVVDAIVARSKKDVSFKLNTSNGTKTVNTPATNVTAPPPPKSQVTSSREIACLFKYPASDLGYNLCVEGILNP